MAKKYTRRKKINKFKLILAFILLIIIIIVLMLAIFMILANVGDKTSKNTLHSSKSYNTQKSNSKNKTVNASSSNKSNAQNNTFNQVFTYSEIPQDIKKKMIGKSMTRDGGETKFSELSYLKLTYFGFDEKPHVGEMVVNKNVAKEVVDIFKELYEKKYPIQKMKLIDDYNGDDEASMKDNNTSSFCYRTIKDTKTLSKHGRGLAIDINPLQNPQVKKASVDPKEAAKYLNRNEFKKGMIRQYDACYKAFTNRDWSWGGYWVNPDYQHFEK